MTFRSKFGKVATFICRVSKDRFKDTDKDRDRDKEIFMWIVTHIVMDSLWDQTN